MYVGDFAVVILILGLVLIQYVGGHAVILTPFVTIISRAKDPPQFKFLIHAWLVFAGLCALAIFVMKKL